MDNIDNLKMVSLQLTEPGSYPVKIDISYRWDSNNTVVVGRGHKDAPANHIALRKATGFISRNQVTIMASNGDPGKLLIRDGGVDPDDGWSKEWKHSFINDVPLSHTDWRSFSLGDRVRFHPEKPPAAGFLLQIAFDETDGTHSDTRTISFDIVNVWESMSRASKSDGVMLLSAPYNDGVAIVQRLDATAESILGGDPGELVAGQEHLIFNNLVAFGPERRRLGEHVAEAMVQSQPVQSNYTFGDNSVNLRLERRPVNGDMPLFGWVSLNVKPSEGSSGDWRTDAVKWAEGHPWLAAGVFVVVAIAVILWLLNG